MAKLSHFGPCRPCSGIVETAVTCGSIEGPKPRDGEGRKVPQSRVPEPSQPPRSTRGRLWQQAGQLLGDGALHGYVDLAPERRGAGRGGAGHEQGFRQFSPKKTTLSG